MSDAEDFNYEFLSTLLGVFLPLLAIGAVVGAWTLGSSLFTSYTDFFFGVNFHTFSLFALALSYLIGVHRMRFLPIPWRNIVAATLVVTGIHLYDVLWGLASLLVRGGSLPYGPILGVLISVALLLFLDTRLYFLKVTTTSMALFNLSLALFAMLAVSGFYGAMTLYDAGLGADPHGALWAAGKMVTLLVLVFATMSGGETRVIRWSLL